MICVQAFASPDEKSPEAVVQLGILRASPMRAQMTGVKRHSMRELLQAAIRRRFLRRDASGFLLPARPAGFHRRQCLPHVSDVLCLGSRRSFSSLPLALLLAATATQAEN
jgi:hypothetical protein